MEPDPWRALLPEAAVAQSVIPGPRKLELGRVVALHIYVLSPRQRGGGEILRGGSVGWNLDEEDGAGKACLLYTSDAADE